MTASLHSGSDEPPRGFRGATPPGPSGSTTFRVQGKHLPQILVVDTEPFVRRVVCRLLGRHGFRTCSAENGDELLTRVKGEEDIGLLILDLHLPPGGQELVDRAREVRPDLAALFMQNRGGGKPVRNDGVPVLVKPFGSEPLMIEVFAAFGLDGG